MQLTPWFDRTFEFGIAQDQFDSLYRRLREAPARYQQTLSSKQERLCEVQPGRKWSVKEHIGHLLVLEPLWQQRISEIADGLREMSPADLGNTATHEAGFNKQSIASLNEAFVPVREKTLDLLHNIPPAALAYRSVHPRMRCDMSIMDMMYFVAEHDDHHLETIKHILKNDLL